MFPQTLWTPLPPQDADVVITDGCPFEVATDVKAVFIDGKQVK